VNINATLIGQSVSFVIFVWFCMKYVWPPVIKALDERKQKIADGLIAARKANAKLAAARTTADEHILAAQHQAKTIIEKAHKDAVLIIDKAKVRAQEEANRLHEKAQNEIAKETIQVRDALRKQMAELVAAGASRVVSEYINDPVDQQMIDKIVAKL